MKFTIHTDNGPVWKSLGALVLAGVVLSGCGTLATSNRAQGTTSTASTAKVQEPVQTDPVMLFIASANENDRGTVIDPTTGEEIHVIAGRKYHAASGRLCRRFEILGSSGPSAHTPELACRDKSGRWQKVRPLLNLDNSRISPTTE